MLEKQKRKRTVFSPRLDFNTIKKGKKKKLFETKENYFAFVEREK